MNKENEQTKDALERFLTLLWDSRLEIGHSVRTLDECITEAEKDITVVTNIMEARLLCGDQELFTQMKEQTGPDAIWDNQSYFQAKVEEQLKRSGKFNDSAYSLEPNSKESRGGLRDIQMIGWVAKRHFGVRTLDELVQHRFLTTGQVQRLNEGQAFLWRVGFGLHVPTGRREDRILFDHQIKLAELLGYEDATYTLAIEQLMQRYYRTVMELSRLNEMLLQLFSTYEKEANAALKEKLVFPAYDYVLKCSHTFNQLDARGAISVTERTGYITRVRNLARACASTYYNEREKLGVPMLKKKEGV